MSRFTGKVALVTGGTSGIGRATALALAEEGAAVALTGRRQREGEAVAAEVRARGGRAIFIAGDVSIESDVRAFVDRTVGEFGRLDVAVNNAGVESKGPLAEVTPDEYRRIFDVNVLGVILSMKHEIPAMLRAGGGAIVNVASVAGVIGMPGVSVYIASKHAVLGLTKSVALEFARQNVRVNAVSPAAIQTDMFDRFAGDQAGKEYVAGLHPIGRVGTAAEVADAILYLAAPRSAFVTGQNLIVDGGFTAQ